MKNYITIFLEISAFVVTISYFFFLAYIRFENPRLTETEVFLFTIEHRFTYLCLSVWIMLIILMHWSEEK